jgi:PAS domain S-box-containing protein
MKYKFSDIVDIKKLQPLMDKFYGVAGIASAIINVEGEILTANGWLDICTKFHRVHPETARRCVESDTALASRLKAGEKYNVYKCLNGLADVATPITVDGEHVANLFTGQFFFEKPDPEFFRKQAAAFNFDETLYLEALAKVPIFSEEQVKGIITYLSELAELIAEMGMTQKRQLEIAEEREQMLKHLNRLTSLMENTSDLVAMSDLQGNIIYINSGGLKMVGHPEAGLADLKIPDFHPPEVSEKIIQEHLPIVMEKGTFSWESKVRHRDGNIIPVSQVIILIRSESGAPESFGTIMRDMSQLNQSQENLRISEEKYRQLAENLRKEIAERERAEKEILRLNEALEQRIREKEGKYLIPIRFQKSVFSDRKSPGLKTDSNRLNRLKSAQG